MRRNLILLCLLVTLALPAPAHAYSRKQHHARRVIVLTLRAKHQPKAEIRAALKLAYRESSWNPKARTGKYRGLFQLGFRGMGNRWKSASWNTRRANRYVASRYGTWCAALAHSYSHCWY